VISEQLDINTKETLMDEYISRFTLSRGAQANGFLLAITGIEANLKNAQF
jgi:hypothetical protein